MKALVGDKEIKLIRASDIQMRPPEFVKRSVAYGLRSGDFADLDPKIKKKLRRLMGRISEASYRRGVQQAIACGTTAEVARILRFERDLGICYRCEDAKANGISSPDERLFIEYPVISDLGLG